LKSQRKNIFQQDWVSDFALVSVRLVDEHAGFAHTFAAIGSVDVLYTLATRFRHTPLDTGFWLDGLFLAESVSVVLRLQI